jgi:hypothetical protein
MGLRFFTGFSFGRGGVRPYVGAVFRPSRHKRGVGIGVVIVALALLLLLALL